MTTTKTITTVEEVEAALAAIEASAQDGDDEVAHYLEDSLHYDVLFAIASGSVNPKELAKAALRSEGIEYNKWCA